MTDLFEQALGRELIASERLKASIFAGIIASLVLAFSFVLVAFPEEVQRFATPAKLRMWIGLLALALVYALAQQVVLKRYGQQGRQVPKALLYANALVEVSLPTVAIYFQSTVFPPVYALHMPPYAAYFLFILLSTLHLDVTLGVLCGAAAAAEYLLVAYWFLNGDQANLAQTILASPGPHFGKSLMLLLAGIGAGLVAGKIRSQVKHAWQSAEERNRVIQVFGQHVSPKVVDRLLSQRSAFESEVRYVCVMFLDIRNFTTFSEQHSPEEVVAYLNTLFDSMITAVNAHNGIINKFLGDGFMAIFGAPISGGQDCRNAMLAAKEILQRLESLNAAGRIPPTQVGIGMHAGEVVTGNVGSAERKEYTVIGDVVNVASRIEQLNKQFGSQLLISEAVWHQVSDMGDQAMPLQPLAVKGRATPVQVFQVT